MLRTKLIHHEDHEANEDRTYAISEPSCSSCLRGELFFLSSQPFQCRDVIAHTARYVVGGLVAEIFFRRRDIEHTVTLFAPTQLARAGPELDFMLWKQFGRCIQKIPRRRSLARANIENPFIRSSGFQSEINSATHVADINRIVQLIPALRDQPAFTAARLLDQLPVKRQRPVTRFLSRPVDRDEAQRNEFNA